MSRNLYRYFASLGNGKVALWCYLIWYLVTVAYHFDPSPSLWLSSLGISAVMGWALLLSFGPEAGGARDHWQTFRSFLMPFCVSSFSSIIKDHGYFLIFPPSLTEQIMSVGMCAAFVLFVAILRRVGDAGRG